MFLELQWLEDIDNELCQMDSRRDCTSSGSHLPEGCGDPDAPECPLPFREYYGHNRRLLDGQALALPIS